VRAATAQVRREHCHDLLAIRKRVVLDQRDCGHNYSGQAVTALAGLKIENSLLDRMKVLERTQSFDRQYGFAID